MAKKGKIGDKLKEGVSVEEIEHFARKYTAEVFLALAVVIASISSTFDFFTGPGWSLLLGGLGAVVSIIFPEQIARMFDKFYSFTNKQEKSTQIIIGVVRLIVAIFVPFIIFAEIGCLAGISYHERSKGMSVGSHKGSIGNHHDDEHL